MDTSSELSSVFSARATETDRGTYVIEVPRREIEAGAVEPGGTYRVALLGGDGKRKTAPDRPQPPVEPGEIRYVEIEDLGQQGDGIARVERGYVIIVPGTAVGDRVKIEIADVEPNFAVGELVDPDP
ncbi:deoxyribonuclease [Halobacteriales archaeon QH_10_67_13]|nr:MAG: deoxyribonuclease [Halobacteriales archaeon QH_10_67_13]